MDTNYTQGSVLADPTPGRMPYFAEQLQWIGLALFCYCVARAHIQSITIDEADTYLVWVSRTDPSHWLAASNNHILNSLLMRFSTTVFGVNHLSIRLPALLGCAGYLFGCLRLCRVVFTRPASRLVVYLALTCNPFILDYLIAARGYGLALACLVFQVLCGLHIMVKARLERAPHFGGYLYGCSVFSALGFAANFSFAIVFTVALMIPLAAALCRQRTIRILLQAIIPACAIVLFMCASALTNWNTIELIYGAHSLSETFHSIVRSSFDELNPYLVNPLLLRSLRWLPAPLALALFVCGSFMLGAMVLLKRRTSDTANAWLWNCCLYSCGILGGALLGHAMLHAFFGVLLPFERTALFIVFLITVIIGCILEVSQDMRWPLMRAGTTVVRTLLVVCVGYFLLCARLTYFREWRYDADTRSVYDRLAYLYHRYGIADVPSHWRYNSCLSFYASSSGREALRLVDRNTPYPKGRRAYVLYWPEDEEFFINEKLIAYYRGERSDVVIAVAPNYKAHAWQSSPAQIGDGLHPR